MSKRKKKIEQREIKFRVWNSKKNSFITNYQKTPHVFGVYNGLFNTFDSPEGFIYLQFTGLLDKNQHEIYEGDILSNNGEINIAITCEDGAFGGKFNDARYCKANELFTGFHPFHHDFAFTFPIYKNKLASWEIVGNIYENKNLTY